MYWRMSVRLAALSKMLLVSPLPSSNAVYVCTSPSIVCLRCSLRTLSIALIFLRSASVMVFARTAPSQLIGLARTLFWSDKI